MGKSKQHEPEPEAKIIRTLGENLSIEVTGDEKKYRNKHGPGKNVVIYDRFSIQEL